MTAVVSLDGFVIILAAAFIAFMGFVCGIAWTIAVQHVPDELADFRRRQLQELAMRPDDAKITAIRRHPSLYDREQDQRA